MRKGLQGVDVALPPEAWCLPQRQVDAHPPHRRLCPGGGGGVGPRLAATRTLHSGGGLLDRGSGPSAAARGFVGGPVGAASETLAAATTLVGKVSRSWIEGLKRLKDYTLDIAVGHLQSSAD